MSARAFGTGTVSFGLVSIPIKLYTTGKPGSDISFNLLHADCGTRLKQQYICPKDNEVVPRERITKGYEYSKGQYVMLSEEEIRALEAVTDSAITLDEFVPADSVDPLYVDKSYYLGPDKGGERAYALLSRALRATGLVGIARYAARGKQHVVMVRPYGDDGLVMHQLRYEEQIRSFAEVPVDSGIAIDKPELDLAIQIVRQLAADEFHPEAYQDEVKQRVVELIRNKVDGQAIAAAPPEPKGEIIDLMTALKASLSAVGEAPPPERKPAKAAPRPASQKSAATAGKP